MTITQNMLNSKQINKGSNPHRFSDLAAEHVDPEYLGIVVTLCEGKAVALWCAVMASHTEQNLIDGVVGNLRTGVGIQQPVEVKLKRASCIFILI